MTEHIEVVSGEVKITDADCIACATPLSDNSKLYIKTAAEHAGIYIGCGKSQEVTKIEETVKRFMDGDTGKLDEAVVSLLEEFLWFLYENKHDSSMARIVL